MRNQNFGIFKVISAAVVLGLLLFFSTSKIVQGGRNFFSELIRPASRILWSFENIFGYGLSRTETDSLLKENSRLMALEAEFEVLKDENGRLRKAMNFLPAKAEFRGAHVLRYEHNFGKEVLVIDKGGEHGLRQGDFVYGENGIMVGRVEEISGEISKVSSISNPGETYEVEILPSGTKALAKGIGAGTLELGLIPVDDAIARGDVVMLLGREGIRAQVPLLVGHIASVFESGSSAFKGARAVLSNRPEILREVFILLSQ